MKKALLSVVAMIAVAFAAQAQSVIDAQDGRNPNDFYQKGIVVGKRAMPYPFLRESDVVWETTIWRVIDFNEKFNQFFYYPVEEESSTQGRKSLVRVLYDAAENGDFDIYADDDMLEPIDWETAARKLRGSDRRIISPRTDENGETATDEWGDEIFDTVVKPGEFDIRTADRVVIKESWYIDKADTRQKVRILALQFIFTQQGPSEEVQGSRAESFCVPMDDMRVRNVLVNANAFDENNVVAERSYDDIFIQRYFDSYITRESNTYNRKISDYLTNVDAIYESQKIEESIFDIESDMWEY